MTNRPNESKSPSSLESVLNNVRSQSIQISKYMNVIHISMDKCLLLYSCQTQTACKFAAQASVAAAEWASHCSKQIGKKVHMYKMLTSIISTHLGTVSSDMIHSFIQRVYPKDYVMYIDRIKYFLKRCKTIEQKKMFINGFITENRIYGRTYLNLLNECGMRCYINEQTMPHMLIPGKHNLKRVLSRWQQLDGPDKKKARTKFEQGNYDEVISYISSCTNEIIEEEEEEENQFNDSAPEYTDRTMMAPVNDGSSPGFRTMSPVLNAGSSHGFITMPPVLNDGSSPGVITNDDFSNFMRSMSPVNDESSNRIIYNNDDPIDFRTMSNNLTDLFET